jgi:protein-L-isoaspartate(D-aspartate) O-methyltransferase
MTDFEQARKAMVDNQLRTSAITDRRLLSAMGEVPREMFVPEARRSLAYIDEAHAWPGPSGRALPAPAPFARLVQLAGLEETESVLDIGTGTGYSAAVLSRLAGKVVGVESDPALLQAARANLAQVAAPNVVLVETPLADGAPKLGPYDAIILEGAVAEVPESLLHQLKQGGRLVALIRKGGTSVANVFVRSGNDFAPRAEFNTSLPPLSTEKPPERFVF